MQESYSLGDEPFILARAPLLPASIAQQLFDSADPYAQSLRIVAERPDILLALYVASPTLYAAVTELLAGRTPKNAKAPIRLVAYLVRMATRPTPFGLFAGVDLIRRGESTSLELAPLQRILTRSRVDMGWLGDLRKEVESDAQARRSITVYDNDLVLERGERYLVMSARQVRERQSKHSAVVEYVPVSLRATAAVRFVRERARAGTTLAALEDELCAKFDSPRESARRLLDQLWTAGLFVSSLLPSPADKPAERFWSELTTIDVSRSSQLRNVVDRLASADAEPLARREVPTYVAIREAMHCLAPVNGPFVQVDARFPFSGTLGADVCRDVATYADLQMRFSTRFVLNEYRDRFMDRYQSDERLVPLLELVDPDVGIGPPEEPAAERTDTSQARELRLLELAQHAVTTGLEIELEAQELAALMPPKPSLRELPPTLECGVTIAASSLDDLNAGNYRIAPAALLSTHGGARSAGRFADLLTEGELARAKAFADFGSHDEIVAELVYDPAEARAANVALRPVLVEHEIRVGLPTRAGDERVIPVSDILVGIHRGRFALWSQSRGRRIRVQESHLLNSAYSAPNICRLLSCVAQDGERILSGFDWGKAAALPFLPRIRSGKFILGLARWLVPSDLFDCDGDAFVHNLAAWRKRWRCPSHVTLVEADNKMLLDLSTKLGCTLLRDQAKNEKSVVLEEAFPAQVDCWLERDGERYQAEFIFSLKRSEQPATQMNELRPVAVRDRDRVRAPGSEWTYARLTVGAQQTDAFVRDCIAPLMKSLRNTSAIDRWFFVRYADPHTHVRLRYRKTDRSQADAALMQAFGEWIERRAIASAAIDTYEREIERYGGPEGMEVAEMLFDWSSEAATGTLSSTAADIADRSFGAWRNLAPIARFAMNHFGERAWLDRRRPPKTSRLKADDRLAVKRLLSAIPVAYDDDACKTVLERYVDLERSGTLTRPLEDIVDSVIHMHLNRCGLDGKKESRALTIGWHAFYSLHARQPGAREELISAK